MKITINVTEDNDPHIYYKIKIKNTKNGDAKYTLINTYSNKKEMIVIDTGNGLKIKTLEPAGKLYDYNILSYLYMIMDNVSNLLPKYKYTLQNTKDE